MRDWFEFVCLSLMLNVQELKALRVETLSTTWYLSDDFYFHPWLIFDIKSYQGEKYCSSSNY